MGELFDTASCNFNYSEGHSQLNGWSMFGFKLTGTDSTQTDFNKLVCSMSKKNEAGGFTGDMTLEIRDTDGTTVLVTGTSVNVSTIPDIPTYSDITFTCDTTTVTAGQYICVTFPTGTNSTNCLFWYRSSTANNCADPTLTGVYIAGTLNPTNNMADMVTSSEAVPPPSSSGTFMPPPPAMVRL